MVVCSVQKELRVLLLDLEAAEATMFHAKSSLSIANPKACPLQGHICSNQAIPSNNALFFETTGITFVELSYKMFLMSWISAVWTEDVHE